MIPAAVRAKLRITEGQLFELSLSGRTLVLEAVPGEPLERFRRAVGPFFENVDPLEFQHELRDGTT